MGLCFNVLGSSSSGNSTLVSDGVTNILVDAGLSGKETARRLGEYGLSPEKISAIVVSHYHDDHCRGVAPFIERYVKNDIPVFMAASAFDASGIGMNPSKTKRRAISHRAISPGESFEIGGIAITCFQVTHHGYVRGYQKKNEEPHKPVENLGFVLEKNGVRIGVALDLCKISNLVKERLKGCAGIVLESNYDVAMLRAGPLPWELKQRVDKAHLSNDNVAEYLSCDFDGTAEHVVLAHLSRQHNIPDLALLSAQKALEERSGIYCSQTKVGLAYADRISETYCY